MRLALTALIFLAGLFDLFLAIGFLVQPEISATNFALVPDGVPGIAVLRGDFTAFFGVAAACMMWGAWRRNGDLLLVPAALFGTAFIGRGITIATLSSYPEFWVPMMVEAFHVILLLAAWRVLPHHRIDEIAG